MRAAIRESQGNRDGAIEDLRVGLETVEELAWVEPIGSDLVGLLLLEGRVAEANEAKEEMNAKLASFP